MSDRYLNNAETVEKIAELFGLKLRSFDPNWTLVEKDTVQPRFTLELVSQSMLSGYHVPDDFMGKVATLMKLPWEFEQSTEHLEGLLKEFNKSLVNIGKNRLQLPEIPEIKKELFNGIEKATDDLDKQAKETIQDNIDNITIILNVRKELENYAVTRKD